MIVIAIVLAVGDEPHALLATTDSVPEVAVALKSMLTLFVVPVIVAPVPLYVHVYDNAVGSFGTVYTTFV